MLPIHPFASVTVTEYEPLEAICALGTDGFCRADVNPFGPVHDQLVPTDVLIVIVAPRQTGLLLLMAGEGGMFTVSCAVAVFAHPLASVPVTV